MSTIINNERLRKILFSFPGKAIELLYDRYYHSLLNLSMRLTHDQKVAEDIVQETFVHVWQNHRKLGEPNTVPIHYYLVRVVKNKAITHYKQNMVAEKRKARIQSDYMKGQQDDSIESVIISRETSLEVRQLIITFPRRERQCLFMKMDEELTIDQIAVRLNVSKKAVERSITSGKKRLKKYWRQRHK